MSNVDTKAQWENHARHTARTVNTGWCLQTLAGPTLLSGLIITCAVLIVRRENPTMPWWQPTTCAIAALLLVAAICYFIARRRFEAPAQSLVRIEAAMRLRNSLSAAQAGVCAWPSCPPTVHAGLRWNWLRSLYAPLAALALLAAAILIPIHRIIPPKPAPDEPQSWSATEGELNQLEEDKVIDQEYIEEIRKKVEELRTQDPQEWFSHSSMEATDTMRNEHLSEAKKLERDMTRAANALGALQKNPNLADKDKARLANEFQQALDGMNNGLMKPNPGLLNQLKELNPEQLQKQLTPEQMQQLKDNLQKNAEKLNQACENCEGNGDGQGEGDWSDELNADGTHPNDKQGKGEGEKEGEGPGKGGVNRGPGHDPNLLGKASDELETGKLQGLEAEDLSRANPGDLLELQDGEHTADTSATTPSTGGSVGATGAGGDRIWRDSLDPEEQKALKQFFE